MVDFEYWWDCVGAGMRPEPGQDMEEHARRVAEAAWLASARNTERLTYAERAEE